VLRPLHKTVEEEKRHKKGKKAPLNASTQRVKSDADAEPFARIRVGEELYNPIPSHLSLDSDEHHRIVHILVPSWSFQILMSRHPQMLAFQMH